MREILFRGKRTDNGEWVYGYYTKTRYYLNDKEMHIIFAPDGEAFPRCEFSEYEEVDPETVCQFTGLYDKNGRKIFEGDIIEITDTFNKIISGVVYWCDGAFWADCSQPDGDDGFYSLCHLGDCIEVIGNIYDNPELLEVKQND